MDSAQSDWLTVGDAAKASGLSETRIRRLCNDGRVLSRRHSESGWRYVSAEDLRRYVNELKAVYKVDSETIKRRMRSRWERQKRQGNEGRNASGSSSPVMACS